MKEYNIIGKDIFFGALRRVRAEEGDEVIRFEVLEGKVRDVICFDVFSPKEVTVDGKDWYIPVSGDGYVCLCDAKTDDELGYYICDLSRDALLRRLCNRYSALLVAKETIDWMMDDDTTNIPADCEYIPQVVTLSNGSWENTDDDISAYIIGDDRCGGAPVEMEEEDEEEEEKEN